MLNITTIIKCSCGSGKPKEYGKVHNDIVYECSSCGAMAALSARTRRVPVTKEYVNKYGKITRDH